MKTVTFNESEFKLVPIEPTPEMIKAWHDTYSKAVIKTGRSNRAYAAMLRAAPGSPASVAPGDAQDKRQAFEAWSIRANQGYDLTPNVSGRMATYESNTTEHAYRGFFHGMNAPAAGDALQFLADTDGAIESLTLGGNTRYRVWWPYLDDRQAEWFASPLEAVGAALAAQIPQQGEA